MSTDSDSDLTVSSDDSTVIANLINSPTDNNMESTAGPSTSVTNDNMNSSADAKTIKAKSAYRVPYVEDDDEEDEQFPRRSASSPSVNPTVKPTTADDNKPITKAQAEEIAAAYINQYHANQVANSERAEAENRRQQAYAQWLAEAEANNKAQVADYVFVAKFSKMVVESLRDAENCKNISDIGKEWLGEKLYKVKVWVAKKIGWGLKDTRVVIPAALYPSMYEANIEPRFLSKSTLLESMRLRAVAEEWGFVEMTGEEEKELGRSPVDQLNASIDESVARAREKVEERTSGSTKSQVRFAGVPDIITSPADAFNDKDVEAFAEGTTYSRYDFDGTNVILSEKGGHA